MGVCARVKQRMRTCFFPKMLAMFSLMVDLCAVLMTSDLLPFPVVLWQEMDACTHTRQYPYNS